MGEAHNISPAIHIVKDFDAPILLPQRYKEYILSPNKDCDTPILLPQRYREYILSPTNTNKT